MELYIGLGSNMGDRQENIRTALRLLGQRLGEPVKVSSMVVSEPWGFDTEVEDFVNAVAEFETDMDPFELLAIVKGIEKQMGRSGEPVFDKDGKRIYESRIIDIDIIIYGNLMVVTPELTIPHPHMWERDFVVGPLQEIEPEKFGF